MRAAPSSSSSRVRGRGRGIAVALTAAVVVAGAAASQGSAAYWNAQESTEGLVIQSGTAALTITAPTVTSATTALYPGGPVVVLGNGRFQNTGTVTLAVTVTRADGNALSQAVTVKIGASASAGTCNPWITVASGEAVAISSHPPGADYVLCASVALPVCTTVGQGETTDIRLTFDGTQQ